jgi:hypothetical protein
MKSALCVFLLLLSVPLVSAGKPDDPEIKQRKEFCHRLIQLLEQETGWNTYVRLAPGRSQDVLQLYPGMEHGKLDLLDGGADMPVEALVRFKREVVDPLLTKRAELKGLGFKAIQIKIRSHSESFPHGTWDIPLE